MASAPGNIVPGPRYLRMAEELRRQILAGTFGRKDFPTEAELCRQYGVSRFTVREALRRLQSEGLIARRRGSGTIVQPAATRGGALHQPMSNVGELLQYARGSRVDFAHDGRGPIPRRYAEQIDGETAGQWFCFSGLRRASDGSDLIAVTEAFVHSSLADVVEQLDPKRSTLFRQIEQLAGLSIARVTQDIQAVPAPRSVAEQLNVAVRSPCLRILRCYFDRDDLLFEISASHHPGDRFAYSMHIDIDG